MALSNDVVISNFRNSTAFDIVLKLYFKYWTKIGGVKINKTLQMACYLKVPLSSGRQSAEEIERTKCEKA